MNRSDWGYHGQKETRGKMLLSGHALNYLTGRDTGARSKPRVIDFNMPDWETVTLSPAEVERVIERHGVR